MHQGGTRTTCNRQHVMHQVVHTREASNAPGVVAQSQRESSPAGGPCRPNRGTRRYRASSVDVGRCIARALVAVAQRRWPVRDSRRARGAPRQQAATAAAWSTPWHRQGKQPASLCVCVSICVEMSE